MHDQSCCRCCFRCSLQLMQAEQTTADDAADVAMRWRERYPSHRRVDRRGQQARRMLHCTGAAAMRLQRLHQRMRHSNRERRQKRVVTPRLHSQIDGVQAQSPMRKKRMRMPLLAPACRSIAGCAVAHAAVRWRSVAVVANQPHELHPVTVSSAHELGEYRCQLSTATRFSLPLVPILLASVDAPLSMSR